MLLLYYENKRIVLVMYRIKQFIWAITSKYKPIDKNLINKYLNNNNIKLLDMSECISDITNEGNTININEWNMGVASYCFCHTSYNCEIKGFREGEYILCISTQHTPVNKFQYKPITFSFVEGSKITFDLGEGSWI